MNITPIHTLPWPLPSGNTGIVPPYQGGSPVPQRLVRDLGYYATHVTQPASVGAYLVLR